MVKLNSESAAAIVRLIVGLAAAVGTVFGWTFDADLLFNILISVFAVVFIVMGLWWKNQNITDAAQEAQKLLDSIKGKDDDDMKAEGTD